RPLPSVCRTKDDALGQHAIAYEVPQGDQQLARQGHDHLLARGAGVLGASFKPLRQGALVLELKEAPRELDHSPPYPSIAGSGKPLLPATASTLVGRAREARVACHGAPVAQVARQDLLDQHVRRLDPNADHAYQKKDHQIWLSFGGLLELLEARLLDLPYLLDNELLALDIALQFGERVGRNGLALGCAQMLQPLRRLLELGIEAANAKPRQVGLDAVDDSSVLANEGVALAAGASGIFLREAGDRAHLAVVPLAAQPAQKGALEQLRVEPVGLGAPVLTRHGNARGMNDMGLDAARPQPAGEPKAVPTGLEGDGNAGDLVTCLLRLCSPPLEQL